MSLERGDQVKFTGYAGAIEEGVTPLEQGVVLTVESLSSPSANGDPESYIVLCGEGKKHTLFADEFVVHSQEQQGTVMDEELERELDSSIAEPTEASPSNVDKQESNSEPESNSSSEPASENKAVKKSKPAELTENVNYQEQIDSLVEKHGLLDAAVKMNQQIASGYYVLGGILSRIYHQGVQQEKGYEDGEKGFYEYVQEKLGLKSRVVKYYIDIYDTFSVMGEEAVNLLTKMGWTKATKVMELARKDGVENEDVMGMLEYASSSDTTVKDVQAKIKTEYVDASDNSEKEMAKLTKVTISLFEDQSTFYNIIMEKAKAKFELEDDSQALMAILNEWETSN